MAPSRVCCCSSSILTSTPWAAGAPTPTSWRLPEDLARLSAQGLQDRPRRRGNLPRPRPAGRLPDHRPAVMGTRPAAVRPHPGADHSRHPCRLRHRRRERRLPHRRMDRRRQDRRHRRARQQGRHHPRLRPQRRAGPGLLRPHSPMRHRGVPGSPPWPPRA